MSNRLQAQRARRGTGIPANPLPKREGDSADTEIWDDNDTPPGIDPRTHEDYRTRSKDDAE